MGVVGRGCRFLAAESVGPLCFSLKEQLASVCYMFSRIPNNKPHIRVESSLACTSSPEKDPRESPEIPHGLRMAPERTGTI